MSENQDRPPRYSLVVESPPDYYVLHNLKPPTISRNSDDTTTWKSDDATLWCIVLFLVVLLLICYLWYKFYPEECSNDYFSSNKCLQNDTRLRRQ